MKPIFFATENDNHYMLVDRNIIYLPPAFYNELNAKVVNKESYYEKKYAFLKENCFKEKKEPSFTTNMDTETIRNNIANLKQLLIEVTDGCNLACQYCGYGELYVNYDKRTGKKQSFEQVRLLIDYLNRIWLSNNNKSFKNTVHIGFYGGEPLLNFNLIKQTVEYLESLKLSNIGFQYNMTTNAMLLDKYMDYLQTKQIHLLISIDGNEFNHSYRIKHNGENSFNQVYSNILKLRDKYPDYYVNAVNFNAVLHNRNSFKDIIEYISATLGKIPRVSELSKAGISEKKIKEYNSIFKPKPYEVSDQINIDETSDVEYLLNDIDITRFNYFIDSFTGNKFDNSTELFAENRVAEYFPTGTCPPFQKKLFLTVNGKILPCEKIGQTRPLGHIENNNVFIDYEYISNIYSDMYSKIVNSCRKCLMWNNCGQCMLLLKERNGKLECATWCPPKTAVPYMASNITIAEKYPFLHEKLVNELISD
jgi:uncharacterized protein